MKLNARAKRRRGAAYLLVLATTVLVATFALGGLLAARAQRLGVGLQSDAAQARLLAQSALEIGRLRISQDPQWRERLASGAWIEEQPIGSGKFSLEIKDPLDDQLDNRPHDAVVLQATAIHGHARHRAQVTLTAAPKPLECLRYAAYASGLLWVAPGNELSAGTAKILTSGNLFNEGTITANVEAARLLRAGTINGTLLIPAATKPFPDPAVLSLYSELGTRISPGAAMTNEALGPNRNPWGATKNPEGVYVVQTSGNLLIENVRIEGTLVVLCPGRRVTIGKNVLLAPYRPDYPALIVDGSATIAHDGQTPLSESATGVNFNPGNAPFEGQADGDLADEYPSEIRGLVHVREGCTLGGAAVIRGALICESIASPEGVRCTANATVRYLPSLYANPPQGYTSRVDMVPQPGSYRQFVD